MILSTIRSGSTHLSRLLNAHPSVCSGGEVFNTSDPDYDWWPRPAPATTDEMIEMAFVDYPLRGHKKRSVRAVGCKVTDRPLFEDPADRTRLAKLLALPGMRCIVLQRRNQAECVRSMLQAWETDSWSQQEGRATPLAPITVSPLRVQAFFERAIRFYGQCSVLIPPEQRIWIDYDSLLVREQFTMGRLWHFLEVPYRAVEATLARQETRPLQETVENYSELSLLFEHTEYASFVP